MRLHREGGVWRAEIQVHAELATEDVFFAVGHEFDEAARFLARNPAERTGAAAFEAPAAATEAAVFRPDSTSDTPSDHDYAVVRELVRHYEEYVRLREVRGRDSLVSRDQLARMHRLLDSMGLTRPLGERAPANERFWDRKEILERMLRELGVADQLRVDLVFSIEMGDTRAALQNNFGRVIAAGDIAGAQPTLATAEAGHWASHKPRAWTSARFAGEIIDILNNPTHVFTGSNNNGRMVDVYYQGRDAAGQARSRVVITEQGQKSRVITAYGEFERGEAGQDPVPVDRWTGAGAPEFYSDVTIWWGRSRVR
jgi:hypothetical protein